MDKSIDIYCDNNVYSIKKMPSVFIELKKQLKNICGLSGKYNINMCNVYNSKSPITNNKSYQRFLLNNQCTSIVITQDYSQSSVDEVFELKKTSKLVKKYQKPSDSYKDEEIPEDEMCTICYGRYESPMQAKCKHVFCLACWEKALKNFLECPLCKTRVRISQLISVKNVDT